MKSRFLLFFLCTIFSICSCSKDVENETLSNLPTTTLSRMKLEESTSASISMIEYQLGEWGYESCEGVAYNGDDAFYGVVFSKFDNSFVDEEGLRCFECGFFQIISDVEHSGKLLTYDLITDEKPLIAVDGDENKFVITQSLPSFPSFSYIYDD